MDRLNRDIQHPMFSIIMPTYNQEHFIRAALDSLINQTEQDWEAIVVNDGSTDTTAEILEKYAKTDARIRPIHKSNGGTGSALNRGLKEAQGDWICWLSSDDLFDPHKLEIHRQYIQRCPDRHFFFTNFWLLEADGRKIDYDISWVGLDEPAFHLILLFQGNYISGISICIKRSEWNKVGIFDESLRYGQDYDMWLRLLAVLPSYYIPERTCIQRNHPQQGGARFPEAGVYDSAKAAIRFLNAHPFTDLFPELDLSDTPADMRALNKALDIASQPGGIFYSLGPHPGLLFRILEWIGGRQGNNAGKIQDIVKQRVNKVSQSYPNSAFGLMWLAASVAVRQPRFKFSYYPVSHVATGLAYYYAQCAVGNEAKGSALKKYMERFESLRLGEILPEPERVHQVILCSPEMLLDSQKDEKVPSKILPIADYLLKAGCGVVLAGRSDQPISLVNDILCIGAPTEGLVKQMISSLSWIETLVVINSSHRWNRVQAERMVIAEIFPHNLPENITGEQAGAEILKLIKNAPVQKKRLALTFPGIVNKMKQSLRDYAPGLAGRLSSLKRWLKGSR